MVALLQKFVAIATAVAFQDSEDPNQFFYVPTTIDGILGETLTDLKITHWGFGKQFLGEVEDKVTSVIGLVIASNTQFDLSTQARQHLIDRIHQQFEIQTPDLVPLPLSQFVAIPQVAQTTFPLSVQPDLNFPDQIEAGTSFRFLVGSGACPFAQFARSQLQDSAKMQPTFALNLIGQSDFQTPAWEVMLEANLGQWWSLLRKRFSPEISAAWAELNLEEFDKLIRNGVRDRVLKLTVKSGNVDLDRMKWQRFEIGKHLLAALNQQPDFPTNFVRVQPQGQTWKVFINLIYGEKSIPSTLFRSTYSVSEQMLYPISVCLNLNLKCTSETQANFQDLGNPADPCITSQKLEELRKRLREERLKQSSIAQVLYTRLLSGELAQAQYNQMMRTRAN